MFESSHHPNKFPGELYNGNLTCGPDIIDFSHISLFQEQEVGFDGIINKQEVARYWKGSLDGAVWKKMFFFLYRKLHEQMDSGKLISQTIFFPSAAGRGTVE